jgi:hypothetical protein
LQEEGFYFGFRQTHPNGSWVLCGTYKNFEEAKNERERSKAIDAEVTIPFFALSKEDAKKELTKY